MARELDGKLGNALELLRPAPPRAIFSQSLARQYWPNKEPTGRINASAAK